MYMGDTQQFNIWAWEKQLAGKFELSKTQLHLCAIYILHNTSMFA